MRKGISVVLVLGIMLLSISGCKRGNQDDKIIQDKEKEGIVLKIAFWGASGEEEALKKAAEGIEDEIEGIDSIEWVQFPSAEEFYDTLPTEAAIGKIPDIVMLNNEEQRSLINRGSLEPLDITVDEDKYVENVLAEWRYQDRLYGIPQTAASALLIINEDIWEKSGLTKYPETWEQVYEDAKIIKEGGNIPICIDISNMYHITQYFLAFGGGWNRGENIASKQNCQAIEYILKMFDEGLAVTAQEMGKTWDGEVFASEECAMSTGGTWYIGAMKTVPEIRYRILPLPRTDMGNGKTMHSYGFSVMKGCQDKELAEAAVEYMTREEAQKIRMQITGDCPAFITLQDAYYSMYPELSFMREELKNAQSFDYPLNLSILDAVKEKLKKRIYGESPELTAVEILGN